MVFCASCVIAVALLAATTCLAAPPRAHLDFDRDHDLWTIEPLSADADDSMTVIVEIGDQPIGPGTLVGFLFQPMVCHCDGGHGFPDEFCGVEPRPPDGVWWNPAIFVDCQFIMGVGLGCEPPDVWCFVAPGVTLQPGERYRVCELEIEADTRLCQYYLEAHFDVGGNYGMTNRVWLRVEPASVDEAAEEPGPAAGESTWGALKDRFR